MEYGGVWGRVASRVVSRGLRRWMRVEVERLEMGMGKGNVKMPNGVVYSGCKCVEVLPE